MFKKLLPLYLLGLVVISLAFVYGCGNATGGGGGGGGGGGVVTNYTITGNLPQMAEIDTSSIKAFSLSTVTSICAIGADGGTYTATVSSDGTFSLGLVKGVPYVLGFYSGTNGTTLEGYLYVPTLGWNSLPITYPTGESVDLGTLTVESGSPLVTCEIDSTVLAAFMGMTDDVADFYGAIDGAMVNYLNIDVNKDGIPDYQQDKSCYLRIFEAGGPDPNSTIATGEIEAMLGDGNYNDDYVPCPISYQFALCGGNTQTDKTHATLLAPSDLNDSKSPPNTYRTMNASIEANGYYWWIFFRSPSSELNTGPNTPPSGTYVVTIESTTPQTYVFDNCSFDGAYTLGSDENIVYPVLNLVTSDATGTTEITAVNYKWQKSTAGGGHTDASEEERKAAVGNYSFGSVVSDQSPHIQFYDYSWESYPGNSYYYLDRDGTSLDLSAYNIKLYEVGHIKVGYTSQANVQVQFRFGWDHTND